MAFEVIWLPKAEERFDEIIAYLAEKWTKKEIDKFISRTEEVIEDIAINPHLYRYSEKKNIYEAVVTKHNLLLYKIKRNRVELLTFFDTRSNPTKKFKR